ncbi:unnamed protein product [Cercopithifilaria johnstoni]|uniref:Uncharacterized protein n=1 Tax=Cercopithifilaria johnstoni TaxID=2874296 RepID=A0A8J2LTF5_9BILA|nr:unnamed protein product [Cercopithifilaria johnstoni]
MSSNMTVPAITHLFTSAAPFIVENFRNKRQSWYDYRYDNYYGYGFHWGRIIFIILLLIALFVCCLLPCICALGIWFAGWFGLRNRSVNKEGSVRVPVATSADPQQQPYVYQAARPHNFTPSGPGNSRERMDSYVYEEKRRDCYHHRPPSPPLHDDYRRHFTSSKL